MFQGPAQDIFKLTPGYYIMLATMKRLALTFILLALMAPVLLTQEREGDLAVMDITNTWKDMTK